MPKPTSTALNINDDFSDDNVNPQYGDAAGQGQAARKSNVTSASVARPSQPAALNTADSKKQVTSYSATSTTVEFSENDLGVSDRQVAVGAKVKLEYNGTGTGVTVRTSQGGTAKAIFTTGTNPYPAGTYYLKSSIAGDIELKVETTSLRSNTPSHRRKEDGCDGGANGTINVGN